MTDMLRKAVNAEVEVNDTDRTVKFVISTDGVDRDGDTVNPSGWDLTNYRKNPVVLWAHDYSQLPVAKCVQIGVQANKLVAVAEFADHPFAETVYQMVKRGFLRATSVGFIPTKAVENRQRGGHDFIEQQLLEFSVVPVPAQPDALVAASINLNPLKTWMQRVDRGASEVVLDIGDDDDDPALDVSDWTPADGIRLRAARDAARRKRSEPFEPVVDLDARDLAAAMAETIPAMLRSSLNETIKREVGAALRARLGRVD